MTQRKTRGVDKDGLSKHHILFHGPPWESHISLKKLRTDEQLMPRIEPYEHDEVHRKVSQVPVLSLNLAGAVLSNFNRFSRTSDHIKAVENLQRSIENALKNGQHYDTIEYMVGEAAIYAVDLQKPYIKSPSSTTHIDLKYDRVKPLLLWIPE